MTARTLFDKVWEDHVVARSDGEPDLLYIDLHLVHEVTSPQAFECPGFVAGRDRACPIGPAGGSRLQLAIARFEGVPVATNAFEANAGARGSTARILERGIDDGVVILDATDSSIDRRRKRGGDSLDKTHDDSFAMVCATPRLGARPNIGNEKLKSEILRTKSIKLLYYLS